MTYFTTGAQLQAALNALPNTKTGNFVAFDSFFYGQQYMADYQGTLSPIEHFVQIGAARGYKPNATFDSTYYKNAFADLKNTDFNAADLLYHFMQYGLDEGRTPNAALATFDGTAYLAANPDVAAYVNANLAQFGGSATNGALAHYVKFGAAEGRTAPGTSVSNGQTFMLTKGLDTVTGTSGNDTIIASVDSTVGSELNTMSPIDSINGGAGTDTLKIAAATALTTASLANISNVEIIQVDAANAVTLDTSAVAGVTNLNIAKAGGAVDATAANTTDINVSLKDAGTVDVAGGKNVTVKLTDAVSAVTVGATTAAAGAVVVEKTAAAAANGVAVNTGAVTVTGGTTINVTQKAGNASALVAGGATTTHTQGDVTVTGNAATTEVTIKQDAAVTAVAGTAAVAGATEVASVKFAAMTSGQTLVAGGLTFTASKDLTAAEAAATFANLTKNALPVANSDTQGSGVVANGTYTGAFTGWTSGAVSGDTVVFTSTALPAAAAVGDLTFGGTGTATVTTTTQGVNAVTGVAAKLGVVAGSASVTDANGTIKTITVDGYSTGTATTTSVLETLTLKNGGNFTAAASNATLALSLEKIAGASSIALAAAKTINVNTIGDNHAHIDSAALETLNVSGTGVLQTESMTGAALKTVTVSGTAGLILATNQSATVTSVNTTATTGSVTASIDGTKATYTGGAGKDTVTLATGTALTKAIDLGAGDDTVVFDVAVTGSTAALNGGDGIDTLSMTAANADALDAAKQTFYTGFERLTVNNAFGTNDAVVDTLTLNLDNLGFTNYVTTSGTNQLGGAIDKLVLDKLSNNGTVVLTATGDVTVNVTDAATGTADVLNAVLSSTGNLAAGTLTAANVETVNISTVDTEVVVAPAVQTKNVDSLTLTADKATTVNVSGAADLTLTLTGSTKVTSIDGSTMTGGLTVTSLNTTAATTIKGGSGNDVLTAATGTTADVLIGGAGNDTLVANAGMSTLTGGAGNDLFVIGTASANVNSYATITDFAAGDLLKMTGIDSFASAKVSLGDTAVFQDYANAALNALNANAGGWFQFSGNTYVVADMGADSTSGFVNGQDFIVKLTGLVDLSNASFNNDSDTIALV
ncbi:beta strand repeat-containing protein [Diaphorobacter nitroreducens]|uniref:beta strand repeat-containing protein n=1 Tax=Diaphorobacter nitroreducens TaxID=164759 RepID=UPI0024E2719C|nr:hypothetical protein [Diaphorobacter nitroreducens]